MVPDPVSATLRPLAAPDSTPARALATAVLGDSPYAEALLAYVDSALTSASDEYRAIGAHDERSLIGLIVFGDIAGALGAGRIYVIAVDAAARRRGVATALAEAACADLRTVGARFVMIELPEDSRLERARRLADRSGFRAEGRVGHYVREGVGLLLLRRDLGTG